MRAGCGPPRRGRSLRRQQRLAGEALQPAAASSSVGIGAAWLPHGRAGSATGVRATGSRHGFAPRVRVYVVLLCRGTSRKKRDGFVKTFSGPRAVTAPWPPDLATQLHYQHRIARKTRCLAGSPPPAAGTRPAHARFSLHQSMAWSGAADPSVSRPHRSVGPAAAHLVLNAQSARSEVGDRATGERSTKSTKRYLLPRFCYSQTSHAPKARGGRPRNGAPRCPPAPGS